MSRTSDTDNEGRRPSDPPPRVATAKIVERAHLAELLGALRGQGKEVVFTNGCFDLLHVGHVRLLQTARSLGDVLVVGVNSDASVRRLKGPDRPLVPAAERAEMVAALACVDWVTLFDEDTPCATLRDLRPHHHVKGGDYRAEDLPEAETLRELKARLHLVPLVEGRSTTGLLNRARRSGD